MEGGLAKDIMVGRYIFIGMEFISHCVFLSKSG
jgi:hypothetical protein